MSTNPQGGIQPPTSLAMDTSILDFKTLSMNDDQQSFNAFSSLLQVSFQFVSNAGLIFLFKFSLHRFMENRQHQLLGLRTTIRLIITTTVARQCRSVLEPFRPGMNARASSSSSNSSRTDNNNPAAIILLTGGTYSALRRSPYRG